MSMPSPKTNYGSLEQVESLPNQLDQGPTRRRCNVPLIIFVAVVVLGFVYFSHGSDGSYGYGVSTSGATTNTSNSVSHGLCVNYPSCASLDGFCCPTEEGLVLGCCNGSSEGDSGEINSGAEAGNATLDKSLCAANPGCAIYGTTGYCCPTTEDEMLHCCGESGIIAVNSSDATTSSDVSDSFNATNSSDVQTIEPTSAPVAAPGKPTTDNSTDTMVPKSDFLP